MLNALAPVLPELWGGSADLAGSNDTTMKGEPSFVPEIHQTRMFPGNPYGRTLHFGIREHAMGAILNGIALHGLTRPYGGTFLVFSDYMRASVRLAALMGLPVTYVWTHDSIGLGEDGPTHQPVEHLWALRAIPGLDVVRPADANEVDSRLADDPGAHRPPGWPVHSAGRTCRCSTGRRAAPAWPAPTAPPGAATCSPTLAAASPTSSSSVPAARCSLRWRPGKLLAADGIQARVVSMPCVEWFIEQDVSYRDQVLPPHIQARVSVEAGIALGWRQFVGDAGRSVGLEHFGASADYKKLYAEFGITADSVAEAARDSLANVRPGEIHR